MTPGGAPPRGRAAFLLAAVAVSLSGAAAVHGERFVRNLPRAHWEDFRFFRHARAEVPTLASCFTAPPMWPGLYRPLSTNCYYYAGRRLFANRLEAYHAVNGILFVANGVLLAAVAAKALPGPWPLLAALLFVTRFAHAQLTLYTSEAQALLSTALGLGALLLDLRSRRPGAQALSGLLFLSAMLAKETVIVMIAVSVAWRRLVDRDRRWTAPPGLAAGLAVWAVLFVAARRRWDGATGFASDVSLEVAPRLAAHAFDFSNALTRGTPHVDMPGAVLGAAWSWPGIALALVLVAASALALAFARHAGLSDAGRAAAFGIAWWAAAASPFVFYPARVFMRYSYLAHGGLAIAVAAAAWGAWAAFRTRGRPAPQ